MFSATAAVLWPRLPFIFLKFCSCQLADELLTAAISVPDSRLRFRNTAAVLLQTIPIQFHLIRIPQVQNLAYPPNRQKGGHEEPPLRTACAKVEKSNLSPRRMHANSLRHLEPHFGK